MSNGFLILDENDWKEATPEQRDWMIFKTLKAINERLLTLEKKTITDKCFSFLGGIVGGFAAALGLKWGT